MKKILSIILVSSLIFVACNEEDNLSAKRAKLTSLKNQLGTINAEIADLEKQIEKLDTTKKVEKNKLVSLQTITPTTFNHFIEIQGSVSADQEIMVTPKMPGTVTRILVNVGDKVKAGQLLAEIDDALLQQNMAALKTQYDFASNLFEKQKALWDQKIGTEIQYLGAKNQKEALEKQISALNEQWEMTRVKAPISGTIDDISMKVGMPSAPGNVYGAIKLINLSKLKVKADVAEAYAGKVREGNPVILSLPDINREINANIRYVGKSISPQNRTFSVEIPLASNENNVIPNMATLVKIIDYRKANAIVVPINLVQKGMEGDFVMVASSEGGKLIARKKSVMAGQISKDTIEITSGLNAGEQLIITGYQDLNDGDAITQ